MRNRRNGGASRPCWPSEKPPDVSTGGGNAVTVKVKVATANQYVCHGLSEPTSPKGSCSQWEHAMGGSGREGTVPGKARQTF